MLFDFHIQPINYLSVFLTTNSTIEKKTALSKNFELTNIAEKRALMCLRDLSLGTTVYKFGIFSKETQARSSTLISTAATVD